MAASGQENDAILGVEILDGGAPARRIQCGQEQMDRLNAGEELKTGDCYFITAPTFETRSEKYCWINAVQAVGKMTSLKLGDHLDYDIFAVK